MPSSPLSDSCITTASWKLGSKSTPGCTVELVEPLAGQRAAQLIGHQPQTRDDLAFLVPVRGLQSPTQAVHDREQRLDDGFGCPQA